MPNIFVKQDDVTNEITIALEAELSGTRSIRGMTVKCQNDLHEFLLAVMRAVEKVNDELSMVRIANNLPDPFGEEEE